MIYNETKNFFSIAFFALLQSKSYEACETLHINNINMKILRKFSPEFTTVDFEQAHIKVICNFFYSKKIFEYKALREIYRESKILPCFFHFAQALWKKASKIGLRKEGYLQKTKEMILNLKSLSFTKIENVEEKYNMIEDEFQKLGQPFKEFLTYFSNTWIKQKVCFISNRDVELQFRGKDEI